MTLQRVEEDPTKELIEYLKTRILQWLPGSKPEASPDLISDYVALLLLLHVISSAFSCGVFRGRSEYGWSEFILETQEDAISAAELFHGEYGTVHYSGTFQILPYPLDVIINMS